MVACSTFTSILQHTASKFLSCRAISSVSGKFDHSHQRLNQVIDCPTSRLMSTGIKPGDIIAFTFSNTVEKFVITFLVVIRVRAILAPLTLAYTEEEFEFYLYDYGSKILLTSKEENEPAQAVVSKLNIPHVIVVPLDSEREMNFSFPGETESNLESVSKPVNELIDASLVNETNSLVCGGGGRGRGRRMNGRDEDEL